MDERGVRGLRYAAAVFVSISVIVHLWWGLPRFLIYAQPQTLAYYIESGGVPDPRPFLFIGLVLIVVAGTVAVWRGLIEYRTTYVLGLVLMLGSISGWVLWHTVLNHGVALTAANPAAAAAANEGHHHQSVLATVIQHAIVIPLEGGTKLAELAAVVLFAVLLLADPRSSTG